MSPHHSNDVVIVTDSSCDLPASIADELGIEIVPLTIRFGDEEFVDREDLSTAEFWARCANSPTLPETAAPAPGQFEQVYRDAAADGATAASSSSRCRRRCRPRCRSPQLAARTVVADDRSTSSPRRRQPHVTLGLGTIAIACARAAPTGGDGIDEVDVSPTTSSTAPRSSGALDTLDNLKKGGRIGGAKALLATALSIKPIIEVTDGKCRAGRQAAHPIEGARRSSSTRSELRRQHREPRRDARRLQRRRPVRRDARRPHYPGEIVVGDIGPVIGTHAGRGTIGVAFQVTPA